MKRIGIIVLATLVLLSTAACAGTRETADLEVQMEEKEEQSGKKILVAYYSATGSTERVAEYIATTTGGELFKLEPVKSYSSADLRWTDSSSRVNAEHDDESLRDIALVRTAPEDWDEYDTIFIGYPIWWGIAAWPVNNFLKDNDFTGKTVIPFCTSASSGLGNSASLLREMAGSGTWITGMRFSSSTQEQNVLSWVDGLNL